MTPEQMAKDAVEAIHGGTFMSLVRSRGQKMPPKFPRGEKLCENKEGKILYSYDPLKVLLWLTDNGLVEVEKLAPARYEPDEQAAAKSTYPDGMTQSDDNEFNRRWYSTK